MFYILKCIETSILSYTSDTVFTLTQTACIRCFIRVSIYVRCGNSTKFQRLYRSAKYRIIRTCKLNIGIVSSIWSKHIAHIKLLNSSSSKDITELFVTKVYGSRNSNSVYNRGFIQTCSERELLVRINHTIHALEECISIWFNSNRASTYILINTELNRMSSKVSTRPLGVIIVHRLTQPPVSMRCSSSIKVLHPFYVRCCIDILKVTRVVIQSFRPLVYVIIVEHVRYILICKTCIV